MTKSSHIRLVIVDDHPLFREGVARTLSAEPDIEVVDQGGSAVEVIDLTRRYAPDILLLDIDMPGGGLTVIQSVATACPATKIVILTASANADHLATALRSGVHGYVLKGVSSRELARIIRDVHAGKGYVPSELAAQLLTGMITPPVAPAPASLLGSLTERERQTLDLVVAGASNKEIAQTLHLTESTVKFYMTNIMQKLQVRNRVEAAMLVSRINDAPSKTT